MANNTSVVIAALVANAAIALLKFGAFLLTGSPAMLSETYHSVSDTGNQVFLLIGIRYGSQEADRRHPFGYGKAQFFYSFLVSVLLFGIAGVESARQGYHAITQAGASEASSATLPVIDVTLGGTEINYLVLVGAILFESYALRKAVLEMRAQREEHGWGSFREAFHKTSDVATLTAMTEDTVAVTGAGVALLGVFLSEQTGNPIYDAASALIIGLLLMSFAIALAWENKRLLLGESLPKDDERRLTDVIEGWDGVDELVDFRTVYFGPEEVLLTADVEFDPELTTDEIDDRITEMEDAMRETEPQVQKVYIEPET